MWLRERPHWLALLGPSGVGKSHLAKALIAFWRRSAGWRRIIGKTGDPVLSLQESAFIDWRSFVSRTKSQGFDEMQDLKEIPMLVLDDIGAEYDKSGFAKALLDELLNARLRKWSVITSNLLLKQIAEIDVRIASRMCRDNSVVVGIINAPDYSRRKKGDK